MKQIGKGTFSTCYQASKNTVFLKSVDPVKECMANGWFPNARMFPKVEHHKSLEGYTMPLYNRPSSLKKALKPKEYEKYKMLKKLFDESWQYQEYGQSKLEHWRERFSTIKNRTLKNHLINALEACANYCDSVCFEISPRNVAVSKTGNLILLDCFFLKSKLDKVNHKRFWN
ncbi:MAG: hypothetical protein GWN01_15020 [Nitrosopumilaceae archaeon]|nr:hypothetical protein [Nitrosopumilaceae archaeon]NIU88563.1 hypothetical protein [Nitrosopumilaceae archaeon]NIV66781.1 hypothetical protein [Nitrosopumilaceae archaeon]NIX62761.1 hypothetical protein [Nitrosopumilaceae archaeon]